MGNATSARILPYVLLFALTAGCGGDANQIASLVALEGGVTINGKPAKKDAILRPGDRVTVAQGGIARIRFQDGSRILLFPDPRFGKAGTIVVGEGRDEGKLSGMLVRLLSGFCRFIVQVGPSSTSRFQIRAAHSVTAIRGTEGVVAVEAERDLVLLTAGTVDVRGAADGSVVQVKAGSFVAVEAGKAPGPVLPFTALPAEAAIYLKGGRFRRVVPTFGG